MSEVPKKGRWDEVEKERSKRERENRGLRGEDGGAVFCFPLKKKQTVISDRLSSLDAPREFWAATGRAVAKVEVELTR